MAMAARCKPAPPALPGNRGRHRCPSPQERPMRPSGVDRLPSAPQADEQHRDGECGIGLQDDAGCQRTERPGEHGIGRVSLDVEHLRDEHDAGAKDRHAGEDCRVGKQRVLALEQHAGDAVGAKRAPKIRASRNRRGISLQWAATKLMAPKPMSTAPRMPRAAARSSLEPAVEATSRRIAASPSALTPAGFAPAHESREALFIA